MTVGISNPMLISLAVGGGISELNEEIQSVINTDA